MLTSSRSILDKQGRLSVSHLTIEDAHRVASRLSEQDSRELHLLGVAPFPVLEYAAKTGAYVGLVDGLAEAAFGCNHAVKPSAIWFVGSDTARQDKLSFAKLTKRWINFFNAYTEVGNVVPVQSTGTISWLKSLDFQFEDEPYTINENPFLRFSRGPLSTSLPH